MLAGLQCGTPVDIYIIGCIIRTVWGGDAAQPSVLAEGTFSPCVYEFDKNACSLKPWEYQSAIWLWLGNGSEHSNDDTQVWTK